MQPTSKKTVMKMRIAYEKTIRKTSTENLKRKFPDRPGIEESSSAWVSRKDLEALLNANNANGLRIYYGCHYASTHADPKLDLLGLHNLIFVATKDATDPENPKTESSVDQLKDVTAAEGELTGYEDAAGTNIPICPPYCPVPPTPPTE